MNLLKILIFSLVFLATSLALPLERGKLEGVVVTPFGSLVTEARVRLVSKIDQFEQNAETDSEGKYNFSNIRIGVYELQIFSPGCPVIKYIVDIKEGNNRFDAGVAPELLEMKQPRFKLKGTIRTIDKLKPLNLKFRLVNPFHDQWSKLIQVNSNGSFEQEVPHAGQYFLQVTASGYRIYVKELFIGPEIRDKVIITDINLTPRSD